MSIIQRRSEEGRRKIAVKELIAWYWSEEKTYGF